MIVRDDIIEGADEAGILRFILSLWDLEHGGQHRSGSVELRAEDEAASVLNISKAAFTQYKEGRGSIGVSGWMKLATCFDMRPFDIWLAAQQQQRRKTR